jgi:hypothetical protein
MLWKANQDDAYDINLLNNPVDNPNNEKLKKGWRIYIPPIIFIFLIGGITLLDRLCKVGI